MSKNKKSELNEQLIKGYSELNISQNKKTPNQQNIIPPTPALVSSTQTPHILIQPIFDDLPINVHCFNCQSKIKTKVWTEPGSGTFLVAGGMCIFSCCLCFFIPFLFDGCQDKVHYCSQCGSVLGRKKFVL